MIIFEGMNVNSSIYTREGLVVVSMGPKGGHALRVGFKSGQDAGKKYCLPFFLKICFTMFVTVILQHTIMVKIVFWNFSKFWFKQWWQVKSVLKGIFFNFFKLVHFLWHKIVAGNFFSFLYLFFFEEANLSYWTCYSLDFLSLAIAKSRSVLKMRQNRWSLQQLTALITCHGIAFQVCSRVLDGESRKPDKVCEATKLIS